MSFESAQTSCSQSAFPVEMRTERLNAVMPPSMVLSVSDSKLHPPLTSPRNVSDALGRWRRGKRKAHAPLWPPQLLISFLVVALAPPARFERLFESFDGDFRRSQFLDEIGWRSWRDWTGGGHLVRGRRGWWSQL